MAREVRRNRAMDSLHWRVIVFLLVALLAACGQVITRGSPAWQRACAVHGEKGCPCHQDRQCDTLWCVNGECAERESF
jgi:hypothetical protein